MKINSRRVFVWLISFLVVIVVYKLYTIFNKTPIIEIETTTTLPDEVLNGESVSSEQGGKIGPVEVDTIKDAKFFEKNPETGEVEREFGYEMVSNVQGSEWEIKKPYMILYRPDLTCKITAEDGQVLIEEAVGRISPSDATLTGNVIIHIEPGETSNIAESFLYLNNIIYISEQSKITSTGPVRFVSDNARMNGQGMELVYNDELGRLEFLRIVQLESLRIRSNETSLLSSQKEQSEDNVSVKKTSQEAMPSEGISENQQTTPAFQSSQNEQDGFYKCIFNKNVEVRTPGQVVASDIITINNILNLSEDNTQAPAQKDNQTEVSNNDTIEQNTVETKEENASPSKAIEVIITCDDGIVVMPSEYASVKELSVQPESSFGDFVETTSEKLKDSGHVTSYVASTLDYFVQSGDTVALGPSELTFYIDDLFNAAMPVPAKITAKQKVTFIRTENKVVFEGDCICSMVRDNEGIEEQYTLKAPRITVNLFQQDMSSSDMPTNIDTIFADGGIVRLSTIKKKQDELLGGIELKCNRFDYFAQEKYLVASGPGVINVDNSKAKESAQNTNRFSLRRRCYARVENFDTLTYFLESNWMVAKAGVHQMFLGYVPVLEDGQSGLPTHTYT
ncbi:MAG: LPS export ABC transporter periplasmic protein LptC, partial [Planctomycetota bacterium]